MKLVVGLGNPGEQYALTRHNIGFLVVDAVAAAAARPIKLAECEALTGRVTIGGEPVLLVKPQTYMNLSGQSVAPLCEKHGCDPTTDLLVVLDEVAIPFGKLRLRGQGSAGGHNGLKSLNQKLKTEKYARLRFGIQPEHQIGDLADFVLAKFSPKERQALPDLVQTAVEAIESWVTLGVEPTMAKFN